MPVRYFALAAGIVYLLVGVVGFIPAAKVPVGMHSPHLAVDQGYGYLFGLFPVNILHNFVHLFIGFWGMGAYSSFGAARVFSRSLAVIYGLLTIMGLFPVLNTTFGLIPIFGHDVWLHGLTAAVAAYFGWGVRAAAPVRG